MGCGECYNEFKVSLAPLLKRIHGAQQHLGKSPHPDFLKAEKATSYLQDELKAVKLQFDKAVKSEEFEEAAALRDKIRFLEKKLKEGKPA